MKGKKKRERASLNVKRLGCEAKWVKCLLNESPKAKHAPGKENVDSQVNPTAVLVRPGRVDSAQKNTILDQGLNTGFFGLP